MNESLMKFQITKFTLIVVVLFFITLLLSTSMRPPYLYLLLNLLIISVGTQTGLLSFHENNKKPVFVNPIIADKESTDKCSATPDGVTNKKPDNTHQKIKMGEDQSSTSKKINVSAIKVHKVKKSPSLPSLFFIGGEEDEAVVEVVKEEEEEEEEFGGLSGQELFTKAETFIGNFYNQLKMQREESWNRIHGF